jgi:putative ABC transport system permease protein
VNADIGWSGLVASSALLAVAVAVSLGRRLGLERSLLWAGTRMVVQLLAVGLVLDAVFDADASLAWSWAWVAVMLLVAAETVRRRAPEVPGLAMLAGAAFAFGGGVALTVLFGLGIFDVEPRTVVPSAGLVIGNSLAATVLVARRALGELRDHRAEVEARLALGLPAPDATAPYLREAMRTAILPQIESTKAVGLIALPGAMTGLILAGVDPIDAVKVQAAVMFLILGAVATAVSTVGLGIRRRLCTADHRLDPAVFSPGEPRPAPRAAP